MTTIYLFGDVEISRIYQRIRWKAKLRNLKRTNDLTVRKESGCELSFSRANVQICDKNKYYVSCFVRRTMQPEIIKLKPVLLLVLRAAHFGAQIMKIWLAESFRFKQKNSRSNRYCYLPRMSAALVWPFHFFSVWKEVVPL